MPLDSSKVENQDVDMVLQYHTTDILCIHNYHAACKETLYPENGAYLEYMGINVNHVL